MHGLLVRLLLIVTVALMPGLLLQIDNAHEARRTRAQLTEDEALRLVGLVADQQQRVMEGAEQILTTLGSAALVMRDHPELCSPLIANVLGTSPRYRFGAILGPDGRSLCLPQDGLKPVDASGRSYFKEAMAKGDFTIGAYLIGLSDKQPTLPLAKPFRNPDGTIAGVAVLSLNMDWLSAHLGGLAMPPGTVISVRDRNGRMLAHYPVNPALIGGWLPAPRQETLTGGKIASSITSGLDGRRLLSAYMPADGALPGLRIAVGLDTQTSFVAVTRANDRDLVLIIGAFLLALVATAQLGGRLISRPAGRLLAAAERWRAGDLAVRSELANDGSEFGRLSVALDGMAAAHQAREEALRVSEAEYRATFEQASVGMTQLTVDGVLLRVNDAVCAITGRTRQALIGQSVETFTHPDDFAVDAAAFKALVRKEIPSHTREKRYVRPDGSLVWINRWVSLICDAAGQPMRLVSIQEDITERKMAQLALEESQARLQLAQDAAGFGSWDWVPDTGTAIWSDHQFRLRGLEPRPGPVDDKTWSQGLHPEDREAVERALRAGLENAERPFDLAFRIVRPDGVVRWLQAKSRTVRDAAGRPVRMVGLTMDVTDRVETEAALRALTTGLETRVAQEVAAREAAQVRAAHAERMQALGQLAGGIAHDFNNVLQMVLGASTLIEEETGGSSEVNELARMISGAADRGKAITSRLLTVGQHRTLQAEQVDVAEVLESLRAIFVRALGSAITVAVHAEAGLPDLMVDKGQLETALINLATNARDAMPRGGHLLISAAEETIAARGVAHPAGVADGRYVRLRVADTGSGMDAGTLAHVGRPFFTTKTAGAGTGLGVAMVVSLTEQSGGGMHIESQPGIGTTVTLWFPAMEVQRPVLDREPAVSAVALDTTPHRWRVLLVDDEAALRRVMALHLTRAGIDVMVAESAPLALAMLEDGLVVDALITDLSMPGMDGIALIQAVHARFGPLPTLLITGYAEDRARAPGSEAYTLLHKPIKHGVLIERLRAVLGRRDQATGT
jgi:PAS domain S-box-containing protein